MRDRLWDDRDKDLDEHGVETDEDVDADEDEDDLILDGIDEEEDAFDDDADDVRLDDEDEVDSSEAGGMENFECAFCGEVNEIFIDRTASKHQQFTEDCEVCCRPNLVNVYLQPDGTIYMEAEQEYEA